jgi:hypothetical protein
MTRSVLLTIILMIFQSVLAHAADSKSTREVEYARVSSTYGKLPISFEPNRGQLDAKVRFAARGNGHVLAIDARGVEFRTVRRSGALTLSEQIDQSGTSGQDAATFSSDAIRLNIVNANKSAALEGIHLLPGKSNYFMGNNPSDWHADIPNYEKVKIQNIYSGIDLIYYGNQRQVECDWIVAPSADPRQIKFSFDKNIEAWLDDEGNLVFGDNKQITLQRPFIFQERNERRVIISGGYKALGRGKIGFWLGEYDRSLPLVIDPVINYATYVGTSADDLGYGVVVDSAGNAYVASTTTINASKGLDIMVTKLDPSGSTSLYSIVFGGSGNDEVRSIAVNAAGEAYLAGWTYSSNFPTASAYQNSRRGASDAFITKLNASFNGFVFSTYFGGSGDDQAYDIVLGSGNNIYFSGNTSSSSDFPRLNAFQNAYGGGTVDAFVAKLNPSGSALIYSSFFGGNAEENGRGITTDISGAVYVTGRTTSTNFPTVTPFQAAYGGNYDAFIAKVSPSGTALVYSTYLGGSNQEAGHSIIVDADGNAYITGKTSSLNFPTVNAFQPSYAGGAFDAIIVKLNPSGNTLLYSTYLGGSDDEESLDIVMDSLGNLCISGFTASTNFPVVNAFQPNYGGGRFDNFVTKLDISRNALVYSSYLGGNDAENAYHMAIDASNNLYLVGWTSSLNFSPGMKSPYTGGAYDAFVAKIGDDTTITYFPQFAIGESWKTSFRIANTGASDVTGRLSFTEKGGTPFMVSGIQFSQSGNINTTASSFDLTVPAGGAIFFEANSPNPKAPVSTGWARFESAGSSLTAAETFEYQPSSSLLALVGVLPSQPMVNATILVDNDNTQSKSVAYAIANPGSQRIDARLAVVREDGTIVDDTISIPLEPGQQISEYLSERNAAYLKFRGTLVIRTGEGKPFIALAVLYRDSLFAVVPAIPVKSSKVPN